MRVGTWNLNGGKRAAVQLGELLAAKGSADLMMLQESSENGLDNFCEAAGLDWWMHPKVEFSDLLKARGVSGPRKCVAVAGRGTPLRGVTAFPDVPLPEKVMAGWFEIDGHPTTTVCYHAPPGVSYKRKKPEQAVRLARWLADLDGPAILGGDFNTPATDPPAFDQIRTHWHSGHRALAGEPGDDLLVGHEPVHSLRDTLRIHLVEHPEEFASVREMRPDGPLAMTYRTGPKDHQRRRFDAIWVSPHFQVQSVQYFYDEAIEAGSDHALVLADLNLRPGEVPV